MIILPVLVLHALLGLYDCHGVGHANESPNGWSRDLKEDLIGHAGLPGTQHGKESDHDEYFTTNSRVPIFPSVTGFMGTHGTYRHLTVHEQTAVLIGDGKHGLFRIQESGFIRRYLKKDKEGIPKSNQFNLDLNALDLNNMDQKKIFDLLKDNYCNNEYHYPDEIYSDNDYLNYADLTIYHPIFEDKYKSHVQIDLPHYFSTLPGPENPHAHNVFEYAAAQPQANKIGPLGKRAGLDIKELYHDVIRFHFMGDAGVYANIGQGNDATDKVFETLQDLRDRAQTLSYKRIDLSQVDHEIYLFERLFQGRNHLYITIIFDKDQDYTYLRKDGQYFDKVVSGGVNADPYPAKPNYFPLFPIENEPSKKKVYGTSVYGHHQSARHEHGLNGGACPSKGGDFGRYPFGNPGASWPTTLEEITPMCDAILLDIKMYYDLDKSWNDATLQLGNAGFYPHEVTNYTVDLNKFGYYTDPYLQGRENPVAMDLSPNGTLVMTSDDAIKPVEILRLDFGTPSEHLDFVESEGLKLDDIEYIQGDKTMMENLRGHAGAEGTQHGKKEDHPQFYETNSGVPILPSVSGFMATHATHRHLSVHEQTIVMIGDIKHGVWRIQENGMVRLYRKKGMVGVSNGTNPNALDASNSEDKLKLDILKKNYAAYVAEEGFSHYKYPDEEVSEEGYLNFVDLTIYHPQFEGKYENHTVIDLPHFLCTMSQPYFPHAHNVWRYATKQKRANKLGPLAIRAGMDVKEHYPNTVRFDFIGDAGLYVNVGTGNPVTDYVHKTLDELRNRTQTLNFVKADLSKMNFEMYFFERPFYGMPYIFVNIVLDYNDNFRYLRPHGPYYEEVKKRGLHTGVPSEEDHFPTVAVEGEAEDKKVIGLGVYGHHHPARHEHKQQGGACPGRGGDFGRYPWGNNGAMWPNGYQEISPVCDGFLLDVKGVYDLDKPWKSDNLFLGNAGFKGAHTINYTVDTNIYGKYEDPYLKDDVNEHMMDLTPDNKHVDNSNDTHEIEHMRLDFGVAGDYLEFIEAKDLRPDVPKETIDPMDLKEKKLPSQKTMDEGDNVELRFVVRDEKDLYSCCTDDLNSCTKQSCDHAPGKEDCHFVANVRRDRGFCGHHLTYRTVDLHVYHDIEFHFNFRPHAPKVKHAKYDTENNCLVIQLEPEDTGHCNLTYSFKYHHAEHRAEHGQMTGTQHTLQGMDLKSCFKERCYDEDFKPYVTIMATNTVGNKEFGEETKMHVEHFKPEDKHEECEKKEENENTGNN